MVKVKLDLKDQPDAAFLQKGDAIVAAMTGNTNFATPVPALTAITTAIDEMRTLITERAVLQSEVVEKTVAIRAKRDIINDLLIQEGAYVQDRANTAGTPANPPEAIIQSAAMDVADSSNTPVGPMPAVEALAATAGDEDGEVDLQWNPIRRGLKSYIIEKTTDAGAATGWTHAGVSTKSKTSIAGLTSGTRYWFRVRRRRHRRPGAVERSGHEDCAVKIANWKTTFIRRPREQSRGRFICLKALRIFAAAFDQFQEYEEERSERAS